jgi:hypothetical protein
MDAVTKTSATKQNNNECAFNHYKIFLRQVEDAIRLMEKAQSCMLGRLISPSHAFFSLFVSSKN